MTDNELMALAMTGSDESRHDSTASFKAGKVQPASRLRVWMANEHFFPAVMRNSFGSTAKVKVTHERFEYNGNNGFPVETTNEMELPLEVYVSMFFTPENYEPVAEVLSDDIDDAFDLCGNNPDHAERWHNMVKRRSLSVGDVVEVIKDGKSEFLVCASIGWKPICRKMEVDNAISLHQINPKEWRA